RTASRSSARARRAACRSRCVLRRALRTRAWPPRARGDSRPGSFGSPAATPTAHTAATRQAAFTRRRRRRLVTHLYTVCNAVSTLDGVRELDEDLPIAGLEAIEIAQLAVVAIAEKHHRLPVHLVGEQHLAAEVGRLGASGDGIQRRRAGRRDVLRDAADEEP